MTLPYTILHILPDLFPHGGTPRKLLALVRQSDPAQFRHVFLVFAQEGEGLAAEFQGAGGHLVMVHRKRPYDLRLLLDIRSTANSFQADLINTHFPRGDIFGTLVGHFLKIPVVKSVHGILWSRNKFLIWADRQLAPLRALTICNSQASADAERSRSGAERVQVIHNGVEPVTANVSEGQRVHLRAELGIPPDRFVLGHVGGLIPLRRHSVILEALAILRSQGIEVHFILVGDGPERDNLKSVTQMLDLGDQVHMLGYRSDIGCLLSTFDAYVNMATLEGFGIAVVEAMQAGVPVILADSGGLRELVVPEKSGLLVPVDNAAALADAIQRLAASPNLAESLRTLGRIRAADRFSISRFAQAIHAAYLGIFSPQAPLGDTPLHPEDRR